MGYFDENCENRERRGRDRFKGERGLRRDRGDYRRPRDNDRGKNANEGFFNNMPFDNREMPITEKEPDSYKDYDEASVNNEANYEPNVVENETIDMTKSNWGEIEDDTVKIKTTEIKVLGHWKARHGKDRLMNQKS